jgi:hypothetical protein
MITSLMASGETFARSTAALMAIAPNCGALRSCSDPKSEPIGVRAAETMYVMVWDFLGGNAI